MTPSKLLRDPSEGVPPNEHGSQPFPLKIQRPIGDTAESLLIYDQRRSIQLNLFADDCARGVWARLENVCKTKGVMEGLKVYVWARRKSDLELSIAPDRLPNQEKILW